MTKGVYVPPQARNYSSPVISLPTRWWADPVEGPRMVPLAIQWATMGGPEFCVNVNLSIQQAQTISQIAAMHVDNTRCGSDIVIWFPDTQSTITIPAYEDVITPVFTNVTQFYVNAVDTIATDGDDATCIELLNTMPPPIALPASVLQTIASPGSSPNLASGTQTMTFLGGATSSPDAVSGTIENIQVALHGAMTTAPIAANITLEDETGTLLWNQLVECTASGTEIHMMLANISGVSIKFRDGVKYIIDVIVGDAAEAVVTFLLYYRTP